MLIFIKLGGSLITDKQTEGSFRHEIVARIAQEISTVLETNSDIRVIIGHGSGSFGHFVAARHKTSDGVHTLAEWRAFAHVATVAAELNYLVAKVFHQAGLPIWSVQPSASAISHNTHLTDLALKPIHIALSQRLIPLVYGDVAIDEVKGGTIISTERLFFYLAHHFPVKTILLLGEVDGVRHENGDTIPEINADNYPDLKTYFGSSSGVDVTGGMETKVSDMLTLTENISELSIRIMNGKQDGLLHDTLLGLANPGTLIRRGK